MAERHAPEDGYDFEAKRRYRKKLWCWIDDQLAHKVPKSKRNVLYLDTSEALETQFLLQRGYNPERLHPVNMNPAQVACLTMRLDKLGLPRVQTHGCEWTRVLSEQKECWHVMSFDGCGPVSSRNTMGGLRACMEYAASQTIVSATLLKGRETGYASRAMRFGVGIQDGDGDAGASTDQRRRRALGGLDSTEGFRFKILEWLLTTRYVVETDRYEAAWAASTKLRGSYMSTSGQKMLWCAIRLGNPMWRDLGMAHGCRCRCGCVNQDQTLAAWIDINMRNLDGLSVDLAGNPHESVGTETTV